MLWERVPRTGMNADIFDAGEKALGKERLSNLHGDEYAIVAKAGENSAQIAKEIQKAANENCKN